MITDDQYREGIISVPFNLRPVVPGQPYQIFCVCCDQVFYTYKPELTVTRYDEFSEARYHHSQLPSHQENWLMARLAGGGE